MLRLPAEDGTAAEPVALVPSPEANLAAVATHDLRLLLVDLSSGVSTVLDRAAFDGGVFDIAWSADGRWVAYAVSTSAGAATSALRLCDVHTQAVLELTSGATRDTCPAFDPAGKYVAFLSTRCLRATPDEIYWQLNFTRAQRPYLVLLTPDAADPTRPPPRPPLWAPEDESDADDDGGDGRDGGGRDGGRRAGGGRRGGSRGTAPGEGGELPPVRIEPHGLRRRVVPVPVAAGRLEQLAVLENDQLLYTRLRAPEADGDGDDGAGAEEDDEPAGSMMRYDLGTRKEAELIADVVEIRLSADLATVAVLCEDGAGEPRIRVHEAGVKPPEEDDDDEPIDAEAPGPDSGLVDVDGRVLLSVDPPREWQQMFYEGWAAAVRHVHPSVLATVDADGILRAYEPVLARVASHSELLDLMNEMLGELGASHAFISPPEANGGAVDGLQGSLGVRCEWSDDLGGWRIGAMAVGDPWAERSAAPMSRATAGVRIGDALVAINHRPLSPALPPERALCRLAGKEVYVTLRRAAAEEEGDVATTERGVHERAAGRGGKGGGGRAKERRSSRPTDWTVRLRVGDAEGVRRARYLDWLRACREAVAERSKGRVGYVHIPDMEEEGYAHFTRQFLDESRMHVAALIVDLRGNCGGYTSDLILARLTQRRLAREVPRHGLPTAAPENAAASSLVVLVDEHTASDGEVVAEYLRSAGGARLVGGRTWGGVFAMGETELVDGTTVAHPAYAFQLHSGRVLENRGVAPEVLVELPPHDGATGRDAQLDAAIDEAIELADREASLARAAMADADAGRPSARRGGPHWSLTSPRP